MNKSFLFALPLLCITTNVLSQTQPLKDVPAGSRNPDKVFVPVNPGAETNDVFEITGIGSVVYTASNTADATTKSYDHNLRITVPLFTAKNRTGNYQLVFYGPEDKIPYSANFANDVLSIYYPISVYESIFERLEDAIAARKKVQVKVTQKPDGFREGVLIL